MKFTPPPFKLHHFGASTALLGALALTACGGGSSSSTAAAAANTTTSSVCSSTASGSGIANYIADIASCGLGDESASTTEAQAFLIKASAAAGGYTGTPGSFKSFEWVSNTWSAKSPGTAVALTSAGWTAINSMTASSTATTITETPNAGAARQFSNIAYTNLASKPIACNSPTGTCTTPGNYPAGAAEYAYTDTPLTDDYYLDLTNSNAVSLVMTNLTGAALTALPVLGTDSFCVDSGYGSIEVFVPAAAAATNYNRFTHAVGSNASAACTTANINTAQTMAAMAVQLQTKATGIAGVTVVESTFNLSQFFAVHAGKLYAGNFEPAGGNPFPGATAMTMKNKTAVNAELLAMGKTALP